MSDGPRLCTWCSQDCANVARYGHLCDRCHEMLHPTPPQRLDWEIDADANMPIEYGLEDSARYPGVGLSGPISRWAPLHTEIPDPREEE